MLVGLNQPGRRRRHRRSVEGKSKSPRRKAYRVRNSHVGIPACCSASSCPRPAGRPRWLLFHVALGEGAIGAGALSLGSLSSVHPKSPSRCLLDACIRQQVMCVFGLPVLLVGNALYPPQAKPDSHVGIQTACGATMSHPSDVGIDQRAPSRRGTNTGSHWRWRCPSVSAPT